MEKMGLMERHSTEEINASTESFTERVAHRKESVWERNEPAVCCVGCANR